MGTAVRKTVNSRDEESPSQIHSRKQRCEKFTNLKTLIETEKIVQKLTVIKRDGKTRSQTGSR